MGQVGLAGAAAVVLGIAAYRLPLQPSDKPLHYMVEGATVGPAETITATSAARVLFSDESSLGIEPSAKIKVLGTDAHGAQVAVTDGAIDVTVKPRKSLFLALRGRALFGSGQRHVLPSRLRRRQGAHGLAHEDRRGRGARAARRSRLDPAGRRVAGTVREPAARSPHRRSGSGHAGGATPGDSRDAVAFHACRNQPASEAGQARRGSPGRLAMHDGSLAVHSLSWSDLIAKGDFPAIVQDAERRGLDVTLASGSAQDLITLADAARYTRKYETARQALLALRARFAGSDRAKDAAFFLGRLSEVGPASSDAALTWYDTYLAEAGRGPYASEALGRKLTLLVHRDRQLAQQTARTYLQLFPEGNQAQLARSVVQSPATACRDDGNRS
jgi:hypothetical protein